MSKLFGKRSSNTDADTAKPVLPSVKSAVKAAEKIVERAENPAEIEIDEDLEALPAVQKPRNKAVPLWAILLLCAGGTVIGVGLLSQFAGGDLQKTAQWLMTSQARNVPVAKASQRDRRQEKLVAEQEDAARALSQQLPMRVDNSLILVGVRSEGIRLHYKYRFDVPMDRERFEQVKPKIFAGLITKNCIAKIQRQMLRNGGSYRFSYVDTSDGYLGGLTLRDQNCS